jgi:hypothetical protein
MEDENGDCRHNRFFNLDYLGRDASLFFFHLFLLSMRSRATIFGGQAQKRRHEL